MTGDRRATAASPLPGIRGRTAPVRFPENEVRRPRIPTLPNRGRVGGSLATAPHSGPGAPNAVILSAAVAPGLRPRRSLAAAEGSRAAARVSPGEPRRPAKRPS
jgi:hypothetical protein